MLVFVIASIVVLVLQLGMLIFFLLFNIVLRCKTKNRNILEMCSGFSTCCTMQAVFLQFIDVSLELFFGGFYDFFMGQVVSISEMCMIVWKSINFRIYKNGKSGGNSFVLTLQLGDFPKWGLPSFEEGRGDSLWIL